ncbi:NUDIX domain-containing protein [bacterium]|nr:NUDIX domain-containing protein [bacterium]
MPIEKSAGAIVFCRKKGKIYYLLLHYEMGHWGFPKGHIEKGETIEETARREVEEETGIKDIKFVKRFKEWIKYFYKREGKNIFKIVTYLLAETHQKEVKISWEHIGFKWLPYKEALEQLTFKNAKEILKKANDYLKLETENEK